MLGAAAAVADVELLDDLVDRVGGHAPVGRELAAGDRDHAARSSVRTVWRRDRSAVRSLVAAFTSGRSPAHVPRMSASVIVGRHRRVDRAQQVRDVVGRALRVVERAVVVGVGGADVGDESPHGTTNTERRSFGTGMTTAMSLRTFAHGTVMWMPFAGRIESRVRRLRRARARRRPTRRSAFTTTARPHLDLVRRRRRPCAPVTVPSASFVEPTSVA